MTLEIRHSQVKTVLMLNESRVRTGISERWGCFDSSLESYNNAFAVAAGEPIEGFVQKRRETTGACTVLNLMGQTMVLRELKEFGLDRGVAVALDDLRTDEQKYNDQKLGVEQLAGDVLRASLWKELAGETFDLIMCRPGGGMAYLPKSEPVHLALFQKMFQLLSSNDGLLLTEVDSTIIPSNQQLQSWIDGQNQGSKHRINFATNFGIFVGHDVMVLRKLGQPSAA